MAQNPSNSLDHVARIQQEWARERPDIDVSPQGLIGRLHRLAAWLTDELATVFSEVGLSEGEFDVLAALRRAGEPFERASGELAERTMISSGGLTKRVDRLEEAGLVHRRPSSHDRRGRVVGLTPTGLELIDAAFERHMANERRLVDLLDEGERRALEGLLIRWLAASGADDDVSRAL